MYTPHIQILYDGFADYLYLAVVNVRQDNPDYAKVKDILTNTFPAFKFAVYSGYITATVRKKPPKALL